MSVKAIFSLTLLIFFMAYTEASIAYQDSDNVQGRVQSAVQPESEICEVYKGFLEALARDQKLYVKPTTIIFSETFFGKDASAPSQFFIETGEVETVELFEDYTVEEPVLSEITVDTTELFKGMNETNIYAISECFDDFGDRIKFFPDARELFDREASKTADEDLYHDELAAFWSLSPVGVSHDGQRALLYAGYYCGSLCAGGAYYLLEKDVDGNWDILAFHSIWVS